MSVMASSSLASSSVGDKVRLTHWDGENAYLTLNRDSILYNDYLITLNQKADHILSTETQVNRSFVLLDPLKEKKGDSS